MATEAEVQALRNQIGQLIGEKVQLQNRVIELERERSEMAVEGLAAAGVRSIRSAEEAMAAEVPGTRYCVPELEITVRGYVAARDGAVLLRLPRPELAVPPEHLGTIRMLAMAVPAPAPAAAAPAPVAKMPVRSALAAVLDDVRTTFENWEPSTGQASARDLANRAAELARKAPKLSSVAAKAALNGLALAANRFSKSLTLVSNKRQAAAVRTCAQKLAQSVKQPGGDLETLAGILGDLIQAVRSVRVQSADPKRTRKK